MQYELYHHGVKGQKWGIRRYQYADGSYTPVGKKRYQINRNTNGVKRVVSSVGMRVSELANKAKSLLEKEDILVEILVLTFLVSSKY